jgi:hypothetical protein
MPRCWNRSPLMSIRHRVMFSRRPQCGKKLIALARPSRFRRLRTRLHAHCSHAGARTTYGTSARNLGAASRVVRNALTLLWPQRSQVRRLTKEAIGALAESPYRARSRSLSTPRCRQCKHSMQITPAVRAPGCRLGLALMANSQRNSYATHPLQVVMPTRVFES